MPRLNVLPLDREPAADLLLSEDGRPVWPVLTDRDRAALTQLAAIFGAGVEEMRGRPGRRESRSEHVVALGAAAADAGALYAHLTGRHVRVAADLAELAGLPTPAVVVTTGRWLDERLMDLLYAAGSPSAPGVVCADTPGALRRQVLLRAAAATLRGPVARPWIEFSPVEQAVWDDTQPREVFTFRDAAEKVRAALASDAGLLHICTHTDGIDADFGPELILCPFTAFSDTYDSHRSPRCWVTDFCHRRNVPVREALASGVLLAPDVLRARVLLWNVCFGLMHPDGIVSGDWGLTTRLLDDALLGAVITPLGVVFTNPQILQPLCRALVRGVPAGAAVARFNASLPARRLGLRMCLLGDPALRLPGHRLVTRRERTAPARQRGSRARSGLDPASGPADVAFLRAFFTEILSYETGRLASLALAAINSIFAYERVAWAGGRLEGRPGAPGPQMRQTVLAFLMCPEYSSDDGSWLGLARSVRRELPPEPCSLCGRSTVTVAVHLRVIGASPRRLTVCPRCGLTTDAPLHSNLQLSMEGPVARLHGVVPDRECAGGLALRSKHAADTVGWDWPLGPDGGLADRFSIPGPWPPGPLDVYVYVLQAGSLTVLSTEYRPPPE